MQRANRDQARCPSACMRSSGFRIFQKIWMMQARASNRQMLQLRQVRSKRMYKMGHPLFPEYDIFIVSNPRPSNLQTDASSGTAWKMNARRTKHSGIVRYVREASAGNVTKSATTIRLHTVTESANDYGTCGKGFKTEEKRSLIDSREFRDCSFTL